MSFRYAGYGLALFASMGIHLAASSFLGLPEEVIQIKGEELSGIVFEGEAFDNAVLAGEQVDEIEPVPEEAVQEALEESIEEASIDTVAPVEQKVIEAAEQVEAETAVEEVAQEPLPAVTETTETAISEVQSADVSSTVAALAVTSADPIISTSETVEPLPIPELRPQKPVVVKKAEKPETRPKPKPEPEPKAKPKPKPKPERKKPEELKPKPDPKKQEKKGPAKTASKTSKKTASGNQGNQQANATKKSGGEGRAENKPAGNAAVSSYPGKVRSKISRTRQARIGGSGTAQVKFTVSENGGLASVQLAGSSGNSAVDSAALSHIRRSAPFPKPPSGAQRTFQIPITFRR
ncbi:MAG: TonB family protein [Ahrensia sp.]|nr:TonB family protein [Ahrensia sp.]